ncbi:MAG: hypothetical protein N2D54_00935, partial [Chloroflexota bacterium]
MHETEYTALNALVKNSLTIEGYSITVNNLDNFSKNIHKLVEVSSFGVDVTKALARFAVRSAALDLGIYPASIHDIYIARGKGDLPSNFTVPAMNLRVLSFDAAKAVFRAAGKINAGTILFE